MAWKPDYITVAELATYLRVSDSDDDDQMAVAVSAASRAIDKGANRQFGQTAGLEARLYTARYDADLSSCVLDVDDLGDITGATVGDTQVTLSDCRPRNAAVTGGVFTQILTSASDGDEVTVTARWGWASAPEIVRQAAFIQASRFMARRDSPFGVTGSAETGQMRLTAKVDPDVALMLRAVYRWEGTVR